MNQFSYVNNISYYSHYLLSLDDFTVNGVSFTALKLHDINPVGFPVSYMNKDYFVFFKDNVLNVQCEKTGTLKSGLPYASISIGEMAIAIHELYLQVYHSISFDNNTFREQLNTLSPSDDE